jgi:ornithine lipid hydroxylase
MDQRLSTGWLNWTSYPAVLIAAYFSFRAFSVYVEFEVAAYLAAVLAAGAVALLEFVIPYDKGWQPKWNDVKQDLLFMVAVQVALPPALALFAGLTLIRFFETTDALPFRIWPDQWPIAAQVVLKLVVGDLFRYWFHIASHKTDLFWRLHAVHHSPKKLYWLNVGRFHPVEKALQFLLDSLPFIAAGVSAEVLALSFLFYAVNGFFQHSNVDARYGFLNYIVSSAEVHRWHHSRLAAESDHNYGNNLMIWDLVFGTYFRPKDRRVGELGLMNRRYPLDFLGQMLSPLIPGLDKKEPAGR